MDILSNLIDQLNGTLSPVYRRGWCGHWIDDAPSKLSAGNAFVLANGMLAHLLNRLANVPAAQMYSFSSVTYSNAHFDLLPTEQNWPQSLGPRDRDLVSQPQAVNPNNYSFINFIVCVSGFLIKLLSYSRSTCAHAPSSRRQQINCCELGHPNEQKKSKSFC